MILLELILLNLFAPGRFIARAQPLSQIKSKRKERASSASIRLFPQQHPLPNFYVIASQIPQMPRSSLQSASTALEAPILVANGNRVSTAHIHLPGDARAVFARSSRTNRRCSTVDLLSLVWFADKESARSDLSMPSCLQWPRGTADHCMFVNSGNQANCYLGSDAPKICSESIAWSEISVPTSHRISAQTSKRSETAPNARCFC